MEYILTEEETKELVSSHPKSIDAYIQFITTKSGEGIRPDVKRDDMIDFVTLIIHTGIRNLYDFFDAKDIMIQVYWTGFWQYSVGELIMDSINFDNRREAEKAAFTKAFDILEQKL